MESFFGSDFFAGNRAKLRTLFSGTAPIVITANGLMQKSTDETFPFRQDSNFWYLTGIDEPDLILVMDKDKEYLILPEGFAARQRFDGGASVEQMTSASGISSILENELGWKQLRGRLKKVKHVATLGALPPYVEFYNFYANPARATLTDKIKEHNSQVKILDLRQHLTRMRVVKQPAELLAIKRAITITSAGMRRVSRRLSGYRTEGAIEADLTYDFSKKGVSHGFYPVVASGANAATAHHRDPKQLIPPGAAVLLDVGAQYEHYSADISRTYFIKAPTKRQIAVYNAVLDVQTFALQQLRPGTIPEKYEDEVRQYMGEKLRALGLIKSISKEDVHRYYPHLTSHSLGIDTHDPADMQQPLAAGMVWTVEPGIYIPEEGIGVRIEDDVLITPKGHRVLTQALPKMLG